MAHTTIALFRSKTDAESAIDDLKSVGADESSISYIYVTGEGEQVSGDGAYHESTGTAVADGVVGGAATGAVVGAIAGLVVANGVLPGVGTLFVAGPLAASLGLTGAAATTAAGALTGVAAGGIVGAIVGLGATDEEANIYDERIKRGDILVATSSETDAKAIFLNNNADEVREYIK